MLVLKPLRDISVAGFLLSGLLLLGIRLYESAYIYASELVCLTQVLYPVLWPPVVFFFFASAALSLACAILRACERRRRKRMEK